MPPKRRKPSQSTEENVDDSDTTPTSTPQLKRRKRAHCDTTDLCQELYDVIRSHKTEDGKVLCEPFIRLPNKRAAADYYDVVTSPIDLLKIQNKIKSEEYEEVENLTADIELMITNSKSYYKNNSVEYESACALWELYEQTRDGLLSEAYGEGPALEVPRSNTRRRRGDKDSADAESKIDDNETEDGQDDQSERASICTDDPDNPLEQLFAAIMTAKDGDRNICEMFQLLPHRQKYPEYYGIIKEPIDLRMIARKIQKNVYTSLDELEKDLMLMVRNAKTFNEPGSLIYKSAILLKKVIRNKRQELHYNKDAMTLKKIIASRKLEVEHARLQPTKISERIRSKRTAGAQRLSAICAALKYDDDDESMSDMLSCHDNLSQMDYEDESGGEGSVADGEDNALWSLYNAVKIHKNSLGQVLSEPFMRLPSKRTYPDYYREIKKPMSLLNIQKKIKHGQYPNLDALEADLDHVFDNAKQFNMDESRLNKDASRLQTFMKEKKRELTPQEVKREPMMDSFPPIPPLHIYLKKEPEEEEPKPVKTPGRKPVVRAQDGADGTPTRRKRRCLTPEEALRRRLHTLFNTVYNYQSEDGRQLIDIFLELPSKKDYPDYYHVISEPIDMAMIENKIKTEKYTCETQLIAEFQLMFNNARHYNEEGSMVYNDAATLEKVLKRKVRVLPSLGEGRPGRTPQNRNKPKIKPLSAVGQNLQILYDTVKDYQDSRGRTLSTPFMKLPLKTEYPDYYDVIKKPIDMLKIHQRLLGNQYEGIEDMVSDLVLMFDNACKYNEPESLIYKDALTLQRVTLEKKTHIATRDYSNNVPDVKSLIQEMMTNLFISVFSAQDEEGRCYSDSFAEMPTDKQEEQDLDKHSRKPPTFNQIKKNLDKGRYRRLDKFQEDMFDVFDYARKVSRTDSQLYEDAVELQILFMKQRDEMCKNGDILLTPALSYTERHLQNALESERQEKLPKEQKEDEEKRKQEAEGKKEVDKLARTNSISMDFAEQTYHVGDCVYLQPRENSVEPHIVCIEKLWQDHKGDQFLQGMWFCRPNETYHVPTRKFLEKEVFKSDFNDSAAMKQVIGKCYVMYVKDYFKMKPDGFADKDVFVCESRYSAKQKSFKKIKIWMVPKNEHVTIQPREQVLTPVRVASVFAEKLRDEDQYDSEDGQQYILDRRREVVSIESYPNGEENCTYYEQFLIPAGCIKLGDFVYVRSDKEKPYIARIDKMWTNEKGEKYFHGPWFVRPAEVEHPPTRLFYSNEVFRSTIEDTNPMLSILGKCSVLYFKEYCTSRLTEIPEPEVYVCESKYLEAEKSIRKLAKPMKKFSTSPRVIDDEIYYFKKAILPQKEPSPLLAKAAEEALHSTFDDENSRDESMNESFSFTPFPEIEAVPVEKKVKKASRGENKGSRKPRQPSGYIVFAGEYRKTVQEQHPDCTFGEISKIVGTKWKSLPQEEKTRYEEKARRIAEEQAARQAEADKAFQESLSMFPPQSPNERSMSPAASGGRPTTPGSNAYQQGQSSHMGPPPPPPRPPSPMFVSVPPRTQRLLHSEAYLRYIEGLNSENKHISDWERNLNATPENTPLNGNGRLPVQWLGQGVGHHGDMVSALWAMRDYMMKDAMTVSRTLEFSQL